MFGDNASRLKDEQHKLKIANELSEYVEADDFGCCKCGPVPSKLCMYGTCCGILLQRRNTNRMQYLFEAVDGDESAQTFLQDNRNKFSFGLTQEVLHQSAVAENMRGNGNDGAAQLLSAAKSVDNRNILIAASKKKSERKSIIRSGASSNLWASCCPWLMTCNTAWVIQKAVDRFLTKSNRQIEMVSLKNEFSAERMPMLRY
jgi:hypothetical protein